jgi:hypothetical protein
VDHDHERPLTQAGEVNPNAIIRGKGVANASFNGQQGSSVGSVQNGSGQRNDHTNGKGVHGRRIADRF